MKSAVVTRIQVAALLAAGRVCAAGLERQARSLTRFDGEHGEHTESKAFACVADVCKVQSEVSVKA